MNKALLWTSGVLFGLGLGAILPEPAPDPAVVSSQEPDPADVSAATWEGEWPFTVESGRLHCGRDFLPEIPRDDPLPRPSGRFAVWFVDPDGNWWALGELAALLALEAEVGARCERKSECIYRDLIGNARLESQLDDIIRNRESIEWASVLPDYWPADRIITVAANPERVPAHVRRTVVSTGAAIAELQSRALTLCE